jgi:excisionase family DNA binding protein
MGEDRREALTIRQAATLLGVHPNTIRNRIKVGTYKADKVQTEHGENYLIPRSELSPPSTNNVMVDPTQPQPVPSPLPDVREAMRAMLEPFVEELGTVREELGRERERREQAERRVEDLTRRLEAAGGRAEASEGSEPRSDAGGRSDGRTTPVVA